MRTTPAAVPTQTTQIMQTTPATAQTLLKMPDSSGKNAYDDDNIPEIDLPGGTNKASANDRATYVEPLPESTRPRKDGPGGN